VSKAVAQVLAAASQARDLDYYTCRDGLLAQRLTALFAALSPLTVLAFLSRAVGARALPLHVRRSGFGVSAALLFLPFGLCVSAGSALVAACCCLLDAVCSLLLVAAASFSPRPRRLEWLQRASCKCLTQDTSKPRRRATARSWESCSTPTS